MSEQLSDFLVSALIAVVLLVLMLGGFSTGWINGKQRVYEEAEMMGYGDWQGIGSDREWEWKDER